MPVLRVASNSNTTAVAGAIAWSVRNDGYAEIEAIGAGAVNQAVKAVAVARGFLALEGIDAVLIPSFVTVNIGGEERTALKLLVEPRQRPATGSPGETQLEVAAGTEDPLPLS